MSERIGLDVGTYNLVCAKREEGEITAKKEINSFFTIPIENSFMLNMIKDSGAPVVETGNNAYILGENSINLALSMGKEYQRPMKNGILSVSEKDAFNILAVLIRSIIGPIKDPDTVLYYSVPADAINTQTNASYHTKVIQAILDKYQYEGKTLKAFHINEALAIVISELQKESRTGIGISFGAGMVNVCYAMFSVPVVQFSLTNSGDWIDEESAKHCGETVAFINNYKQNIDLSRDPISSTERAIAYHYELMIEQAIKGIKEGIIKAGTKANPSKPVNIVLAGGTASPKGFVEFFAKTLKKTEFPIPIGEIILAKDHLYTVSKGCLLAAEAHKG